jgi:uncharacterized protein (DUF58 family)
MERVGLIGSNAGDVSSRRRARRGDEISGSRRYVYGDTVRDIHWKSTARTGRPSVKQYDAGAEDSVIVGLDLTFDYGEGSESTLEYAATLCASVARAISIRGGSVSVATGSDLAQPTYDWSNIMHTLAIAERDAGSPLATSLKDVLPGQRVFAGVSSKDAASISALAGLSRRSRSPGRLCGERRRQHRHIPTVARRDSSYSLCQRRDSRSPRISRKRSRSTNCSEASV